MNGTLRSKEHHNFFRRALTDEYDCLLCLKHCLRCEETAGKLVGYSHGLYTVAVCIMSNFSKSRILALEVGDDEGWRENVRRFEGMSRQDL